MLIFLLKNLQIYLENSSERRPVVSAKVKGRYKFNLKNKNTKKIFFITIVLLMALLLTGSAWAGMLIPANENAKEKAKAPENSPVIDENWNLERIDFIHYAKPNNPGKPDKPDKSTGETCYKLLGVKWKESPVDYVINPTNSNSLTESFVVDSLYEAAETWDAETSLELLNDNYSVDYGVQYGVQDYQNALVFGDYGNDNIIAVTSIWYTPRGRKIVEFDMMFNTAFDWGNADIDPALMDLQNIATHEFGHAVGLADIYSDTCSTVTMYGYSQEGDIEKRTLEQPDIDGVERLYGK